jgi:SagB-type dehydrogenase family enzyme
MPDLISANEYHRRTKYSRDRLPKGGLDPSNQPETLKNYKNAQTVPFSKELVLPRIEAARALLGNFQRKPESLSLDFVARLLYMSYGFTDQVDYQTRVFYYRSAPSAGALYPVEIYLAAKGVEGLDDGLYHYNLEDFSLNILHPGAPPPEIPAPAIYLSTIFFRSAWKYKERAFRYCLLDTGHVAENIGIISSTLGLRADFTADFDDHALNEYLGLEPEKEAVLGMLRLVTTADETPAQIPENISNPPEAEPVAAREIHYDIITRVWEKTIQSTEETLSNLPAWPGDVDVSLPAPDQNDFHGPTLVAALQNRRSRRNFKPRDIQRGDLSRLLSLAATPDIGARINLSLVTNAVQDLPDGCYRFQPANQSLKKVMGGFIGLDLSKAVLNQDWLGRANLVLVMSSPLERLEQTMGPRALRYAYLAAGRLGQRAYLACEVMDWGCCGVGAFYDDDVREILRLPREEEVMYIMPLGPYKQRTHGGRPAQRL